MNQRALPLAGVKVVELGQLLAGPFAGTLLAYFGAEVIKVEWFSRFDLYRLRGVEQLRGTMPEALRRESSLSRSPASIATSAPSASISRMTMVSSW